MPIVEQKHLGENRDFSSYNLYLMHERLKKIYTDVWYTHQVSNLFLCSSPVCDDIV